MLAKLAVCLRDIVADVRQEMVIKTAFSDPSIIIAYRGRSLFEAVLPHRGYWQLPYRLTIFSKDGVIHAQSWFLVRKEHTKEHFGILPGVVIEEHINQTIALLWLYIHEYLPRKEGKTTRLSRLFGIKRNGIVPVDRVPVLCAKKEVRFRGKPVQAGQILVADVVITHEKREVVKGSGSVFVEEVPYYLPTGPICSISEITGARVKLE